MMRRSTPGQLARWCRKQARIHREAAACIRVTDIGSDTAGPLSAGQRIEWLDAAARWDARADLLAWAARHPRLRLPQVAEFLRVEGLRGGYEASEIAWLVHQLPA